MGIEFLCYILNHKVVFMLIHKACSYSLLFIFGTFSILIFAGCTAGDLFFAGYDNLLSGNERPKIGITYFPYNAAMSQRLARPVPDYSGWPRERMVKDLHRISELGVDLVIIAIDAGTIKSDHRKSRYRAFFTLIEDSQFPAAALKITSENSLTPTERRALFNWIVKMRDSYPGAFFKFKGRSLVILPPSIKSWRLNHPALLFRFTAPSRHQWFWGPPKAGQNFRLDNQSRQAIVFAGWKAEGTQRRFWQMPRNQGRTLRQALRTVVGRGVDFICVDSWNNFQKGSFIEPNTLDGRSVYKKLQEEISRIKQAGSDRTTVTPRY